MSTSEADRPPVRRRRRADQKAERRRAFLGTARAIVNVDGLPTLTMQRVTTALGVSEGSIYNYFESKNALLAALQAEALETMSDSFSLGQRRVEARLRESGASDRLAALTCAVASARFWGAAESTLPNEIELSRRIFTQPGALGDEHGIRVLGAGLGFLQLAVVTLDRATDAGVLAPGENPRRALLSLASVIGTLLTGRLGTWDAELFDAPAITFELISHLYSGWGAPADLFAQAVAVLDAMDEADLAPNVP